MPTSKTFNYPHFDVTHIINPKLKNISILIKPHGEVILKSPRNSYAYLKDVLDSKRHWIEKKLVEFSLLKRAEFGKEIEYFGEIISIDALPELKAKILKAKDDEKRQKAVDTFYKKNIQEYLPERVAYFSKLMGLEYKEIKYRKMRRRWGSCSSSKILTFNSYLMKASHKQIDYVIIHELAHLKEMNHSKHFYTLIENIMPNYKEVQRAMNKINLV